MKPEHVRSILGGLLGDSYRLGQLYRNNPHFKMGLDMFVEQWMPHFVDGLARYAEEKSEEFEAAVERMKHTPAMLSLSALGEITHSGKGDG